MRKCPYCAEDIQDEAVKCPYCRSDLREAAETPVQPAPVPTPAPMVPQPSGWATPTMPQTGWGPPPVVVRPKTNGFAVASLVLGIVWIYGIGSILALVFGYVGKSQIDRSGGQEGGRGLAIAGIVLGWVGVAGVILIIVLALAVSSNYNY